jgi:polyisoprenoid-binding protein YceI
MSDETGKPSFFRRKSTYLVGIPVIVLLALVGGPFVYINFIRDDAPPPLSLDDATSSTARGSASTAPATLDGTWTVTDGTTVGYRVQEVLFGQSATAAGRTSDVTGQLTLTGTTVPAATFTVDMTTVKSDQSNRDNQFQGRIMDTARFPTATFTLSEPIVLDALPKDRREVTARATGDLTLHGTEKSVTFPLKAVRNGGTITVNGTIPINFPDWGIPNPSGGPASVGDDGELEFLVAFTKQ